MVVGAEERAERARKDVVARGRQETEGAGHVPWGEQEKAYAGDREMVPPRSEPMIDGDGVFTKGRVALRMGGLGIVVVGDEQGASCVADLEARVGEADAGFLQAAEPRHRSRAAVSGPSCGRVHVVWQVVETGAGDVGVEVAGGGGVIAGHRTALAYSFSLHGAVRLPPSLLDRDVSLAMGKVP